MNDWNHDGNINFKDHMLDYEIFGETGNNSGGGYSSNSGGGCFAYVIVAILVIIGLALLLGVSIPGAAWGFFLKVIGVCLFFGFLSSIGK